jgi:hypothetical protein
MQTGNPIEQWSIDGVSCCKSQFKLKVGLVPSPALTSKRAASFDSIYSQVALIQALVANSKPREQVLNGRPRPPRTAVDVLLLVGSSFTQSSIRSFPSGTTS